MAKLMLIDGNSIINRAFYALPLLSNSEGVFTNAVYGFLNIFYKLYDMEKPEYVAVAFDLKEKTFRHMQYENYKAGRKGMPDELYSQLVLLKSLLLKMNIKCLECSGYEADDILGTFAKNAELIENLEAIIVSGDRDVLQLASSKTKIILQKTKNGRTEISQYYEKDVLEQMGVTPTQYVDVKALMGDASDNIPGVPSIGEKTAFKIISEYKTIENAIENAENIKPKKASQSLTEHKEIAILSKQLAKICTSVPIEFSLEQMLANKMFNEQSFSEIKRLQFKSLFSRFEQNILSTLETKKDNKSSINYRKIITLDKLQLFLNELMQKQTVAFSTIFIEDKQKFQGVSFCFSNNESNEAVFVEASNTLCEACIMETLKPFFSNQSKKLTLHLKKELVYTSKLGINISNVIFDASLAAYIINSLEGSFNYNDIAAKFLNENYEPLEEIAGKGKSKLKADEIEQEKLLTYCCRQAEVVYRTYPIMDKILIENNQSNVYYNIELPFAYVLKDMEIYGIKIDKQKLISYGKTLDELISTITWEIHALAGEPFNINSPIQLSHILFEKLGLKGTKKTTKGYSTSADVLEKLLGKHEIIEKIIEYRTYAKLKTTYVDGLLAVIDEKTGKIYSTFNQTVTATGRISSTEPNLQNIPIKFPLGRQLREAFIPSSDEFVFLDGDYSQIELRVLAHLANDQTLIEAFNKGEDIHRLTASQVFKVPIENVTNSQRSNAKAVNFGIVYGISAFSLSQDLNITVKEAENYIQNYFEKYPKIKQYLDNSIKYAKAKGFAETIFNRRRAINELSSSNFAVRSFGERVAMNMPIQGTAADIIKIAMIKVNNALKVNNLKSRLILQVHDELLFEVHVNELQVVKDIVKHEMENAVKLNVALETDFHVGRTWFDAK